MRVFSKKRVFYTIAIFFIVIIVYFITKKVSINPISIQSFKLNTFVTITIYDSTDENLLTDCLEICDKYELIFSKTNEKSELYQLNNRLLSIENGYMPLSKPLFDLINTGLFYSQMSNGSFSIAIEPLSSLWDFTSEAPKIPSREKIAAVLPLLDSQNIIRKDSSLRFEKEGMGIDLGALAKGYIADRIKDYLLSQGVKSATINLGGNVLCIGSKPDGSPFEIGIQKPFAARNESLLSLPVSDKSVVSSGVYERYFEIEEKRYHHILNPKTGYPYENDLLSVTIISDHSIDGDALSTLCFSLGLEDGLALINRLEDVDALFIDDNNRIFYSNGFEKKYLQN